MRHTGWVGCVAILGLFSICRAEDKVFSGPQPGEKTPSFKVLGAFGAVAGKEFDPIKEAAGKPTVLIFCHGLTRPGAAVMRSVGGYAASLEKTGLRVYIVRLHADRTEAKTELTRTRAGFPPKVDPVISLDGVEGPGSYGLNRKMELTILVSKAGKVTANFALIQPSVSEVNKIGAAIAKVAGVKAPTQEEMEKFAFPARKDKPKGNERDPKLVELLRSVIQRDATAEQVKKAAAAVDKLVTEKKELQKQLGEISGIAFRQKYGTEEAQKVLKAWAEKYGPRKK